MRGKWVAVLAFDYDAGELRDKCVAARGAGDRHGGGDPGTCWFPRRSVDASQADALPPDRAGPVTGGPSVAGALTAAARQLLHLPT